MIYPRENPSTRKNLFTGSLFTTYFAWADSGLNSSRRGERLATDLMSHDPAEKMLFATGVSEFQYVPQSTSFSSREKTDVLICFRLAVNGMGLVTLTAQSFHSEGDVLVLIGKAKVKPPLCRSGQALSFP